VASDIAEGVKKAASGFGRLLGKGNKYAARYLKRAGRLGKRVGGLAAKAPYLAAIEVVLERAGWRERARDIAVAMSRVTKCGRAVMSGSS